MADGDEDAAEGMFGHLAGVHVADEDRLDRRLTEHVLDDGVPQELDLGVGVGSVLHDLRRPQRVTAVDDRHRIGEPREERGLLDGGVAATDDADVVAAEEESVAGCAGREPVPDEALLGLEAQHERLGAGGDDHGFGDVGGLGIGVADPDLERALGEVDLGCLHREDRRSEAARLGPEVDHELGARDALGEPREVLDLGGQHELTAGLIARRGRLALQDDGVQVGPGGVDGGGEPRRARPDDDDFAMFAHDAYLLLHRPNPITQKMIPSPV